MKFWTIAMVAALAAVISLWAQTQSETIAATGRTARSDLIESSGAAMSHAQPGVFFTINDSGNEPFLYATDITGADRGAWRVAGATNIDWEAISIGPCTVPMRQAYAHAIASSCVYIGDTGDNRARHPKRVIYRIPEPKVANAGFRGATPPAEKLEYTYSAGPRDVEAMYVETDGTINLISKRRLKTADGRLRSALVFRIAPRAWQMPRQTAPFVAELVDSLPIVPGSGFGRLITDAALSPDAKYLAVRTYSEVYILANNARLRRIDRHVAPAICDIAALRESQGEGLTWYDTTGALVLTSEGRSAPVRLVRCPLP